MNSREFETWIEKSPVPIIARQYSSESKDDLLDFRMLATIPDFYNSNTHVVISLNFLHKLLLG